MEKKKKIQINKKGIKGENEARNTNKNGITFL